MTDPARAGHRVFVEVAVTRHEPQRGLDSEYEARFASLYHRNHGFVWRILRRFGVPPQLLEDATQDVFVVVHRRWLDYDDAVPIRSWLFGVARRVAAPIRRGEARAARKLRAVPEPPPPPSPEDAARWIEAAEFLEAFLEDLPEEQSIVFMLAEVEGMSGPEIAAAMGGRINTVYSRLRLARRALKRALTRSNRRGRYG